jgi:hypothetical protein
METILQNVQDLRQGTFTIVVNGQQFSVIVHRENDAAPPAYPDNEPPPYVAPSDDDQSDQSDQSDDQIELVQCHFYNVDGNEDIQCSDVIQCSERVPRQLLDGATHYTWFCREHHEEAQWHDPVLTDNYRECVNSNDSGCYLCDGHLPTGQPCPISVTPQIVSRGNHTRTYYMCSGHSDERTALVNRLTEEVEADAQRDRRRSYYDSD